MSRTVAVAFYDGNGDPLTGLAPTFTAYKTLAGVNIGNRPVVSELGLGLYAFTLSATDEITGIAFILDGGAVAIPRYYADSEDPTASAQAGGTVDPVAVPLFGVTPELVKRRHFPQWNSFTTNTNPSLATVLELIDECAAQLVARLLQESISASALTVTNAAAYLWCRRVLRLMAAIEILSVATQQAPPLSAKWQAQLDALWKELSEKGYLALGSGVSAPSSPADGPTTHVNTYGFDVGDIAGDGSTVIPRLRRDDDL